MFPLNQYSTVSFSAQSRWGMMPAMISHLLTCEKQIGMCKRAITSANPCLIEGSTLNGDLLYLSVFYRFSVERLRILRDMAALINPQLADYYFQQLMMFHNAYMARCEMEIRQGNRYFCFQQRTSEYAVLFNSLNSMAWYARQMLGY